jgi:hypothetical protein
MVASFLWGVDPASVPAGRSGMLRTVSRRPVRLLKELPGPQM